jgi:hypothetical protein
MKTILKIFFTIFIFYFSIYISAFSQNLVPNPSFKEYSSCPNDFFMLPHCWYTCSGNPDYFNACDTIYDWGVPANGFGYQEAADGKGYCGFHSLSCTTPHPYYKEYLGCQLITPLIIGNKYYVSFKVNFSGGLGIGIATNNIGLLFSTQSYTDYDPYDLIYGVPTINFAHIVDTNIITDSVNWTTIKGSIIADSAYKHILIGNFFDDEHTDTIHINNSYLQRAYYYLDDVCVSEDSITCINVDNIKKNNNIYEINIYPNPTSKFINIKYNINDSKKVSCYIYNSFGILIKHIKQVNVFQNKNNIINVSKYPSGIYFIKLLTGKEVLTKKLVILK